jgi:mRNA-degrading endonuclease toxin of MazEF toxin-antitoxin module
VTTPCRGRIIWAEVLDSQSRNRKRRPLVIITATDQIQPGVVFHAVAVSSQLDEAPADVQVELPWHPNRHPRTLLTERCAAVCSWIVQLNLADVLEYAGTVPGKYLTRILETVDRLSPPAPPPPTPP